MLESGQSADFVTVGHALAKQGLLESLGGRAYLASLTEGLIRRKSVRDYVELVREAAQIRRLVDLTERVSNAGLIPSADLQSLLAEAEEGLLEIRAGGFRAAGSDVRASLVPLMDRMRRERTRKGALLGLPSGVDSLDAMTRGMQPGEVTVVGARSGIGKSSLMTQAAVANCQFQVPVMIFSIEMSREQSIRRILAAISGVAFPRVRDPRYANDVDMEALTRAGEAIASWPLHIVDDSSISIEKLAARARLAIRRDGVKLVCVDYAQIVSASGRDERLRVAAVSRGMTRLAKDEGIPVMLLSQLARPDRSSPNRRPAMSDLRESSQLENDAHSIVLLHREWDDESKALSSDGELIIAKQRSGETGVLPVTFDRRSLFFQKRVTSAGASISHQQTWMESRERMEMEA